MHQLRALVGLRWRMVRSPRARAGLIALLGVFLALLAAGVLVGQHVAPGARLFDLVLLTPTLYVVFLVLTVVAPLVAGGGNALYPEEQLLAYPVESRAVFAGSVLMAPLNLAWGTQLVVLVTATAAGAARGPLVVLTVLTVLVFAATATVVGQALAWTIIGIRQSRAGRRASWVAGALLAVVTLGVLLTGSTSTLLDAAPTRLVVIGAFTGAQGRFGHWVLVTGLLTLITYVAARLGSHACDWALRRTAPLGRPELKPVARRPARRTVLGELVAVDQGSVWRSTSLRRGALVLALLPGAVAMLAHPSWASLTLLPGLVAAGAGLLFGVNAFCLDGGGSVFVATQPHEPRHTFVAKLLVVTQVCLVAVLLAVVLASTQVRALPSAAELVALLGSIVGSTMLVVAACGRLSVEKPHKADLRGPRDTPAPPATMAVYSIRLALGTTWAGLAFVAAAESGSVTAASAASVAVLAFAGRSVARTMRAWDDARTRAQVVTTVAFG